MLKRLPWLIILFCLFAFGTSGFTKEADPTVWEDARFQKAFQRTTHRLTEVSKKKPFRFTFMNDSLELTAKAALKITQHLFSRETLSIAEEARKRFHENAFSLLLQALIHEETGNKNEATRLYLQFHKETRHVSNFDGKFLNPFNYHEIRRGVENSLQKKDLLTNQNKTWLDGILQKKSKGQLLFIFILTAMGILLVILHLSGTNLATPLGKRITLTYRLMLFSIALSWGSSFTSWPIPLVPCLGILFSLAITSQILWAGWQRFKPLEKGSQRCPKCLRECSTILCECPECGHRLNG